MSAGLAVLAPSETDVRMMIAAKVHIGDTNHDHRMGQYIHAVNQSQNHIINVGKTWEKLMMAARAIASIDNPADVACISGKPQGQRAILKVTLRESISLLFWNFFWYLWHEKIFLWKQSKIEMKFLVRC